MAIDPAAERKGEEDVADHEGKARERAGLRVVEPEIVADRIATRLSAIRSAKAKIYASMSRPTLKYA
jgi:hypothetical protein